MSEHGASELAGSSLVTKNKNPEGELTGENLNKLKTGLHEILREIQEFDYSIDEVKFLQKYTGWLTSLNQFIAEILQHFPLKEAEYTATLEKCRYLLLQGFLRFERTQPSLFKPNPADLATANRLDPSGKCIDLEAVAELYRPNFWLDIKRQIEEIAQQLIEIIEEKSNTSPEQSQVESRPSDGELKEQLEKFNQHLKEINEAADREILKGIVDSLFRHKIRVGTDKLVTEELTIMELVSTLLGEKQTSEKQTSEKQTSEKQTSEKQTSEEDKKDKEILKALEKVKGEQKLYSDLRNYFISHRIPISSSIGSENIEKYKKLFLWLWLSKLEGREVEITLRDTSKLSYLKALLEKIKEQEPEILEILNRRLRNLGHKLNIDYFTNALRFLIKIIEKYDASIESSADVKNDASIESSADVKNDASIESSADVKIKKGVVSFKEEETKPRRRAKTGRGDATDTTDTILKMVVKEAQGRNRNPEVCEFIAYPQYMCRSLFNIGEISLVGE